MRAVDDVAAWQRHRAAQESALVEEAARARGCDVDRLDDTVVVVRQAGRQLLFTGMQGPSCSAAARALCDHKMRARARLGAAGLRTPLARDFVVDDADAGWRFAEVLLAPVVVKPLALDDGLGVSTGVDDEGAFRAAWQEAARWQRRRMPRRIVVEEQVAGEDLRCFVVDGALVAVLHRRGARVEGDGQTTVRGLIARRDAARAANPLLAAHPTPTDPSRLELLAASGHRLDSVPDDGEVVALTANAGLAAGAEPVDVTDEVHPGYGELAVHALAAFPGMHYGAVDIRTTAPAAAPDGDNHVVTEVEFAPAPISHFPAAGPPRDVVGAILEVYLGA